MNKNGTQTTGCSNNMIQSTVTRQKQKHGKAGTGKRETLVS
jgi:hypothetical protein